MSIGARSQSAKTYLEKYHQEFAEGKRKKNLMALGYGINCFNIASLEELVRHGLQALRDTLQQDKDLNIHNTSLGIVGENQAFEIIEGEALQRYLDLLGEDTGRTRLPGGGSGSAAATTESTNEEREDTEPAAAVLFEAADPMDTN